MSASYYNNINMYSPAPNHGRARRGGNRSASQAQQRMQHIQQFGKMPRPQELENVAIASYMRDFEAAKSFEFEDDEVFCPFHLLTEDDVSFA